jgi:hypothetical protein
MSRPGAVAQRELLESESSPHAILAFLTIDHPGLAEPIRLVSDVMNYVVGGLTFVGIPFDMKALTDTETSPRTQIVVPNLDRRIGQAVRESAVRPKVRMDVRTSADFDLTVDPRVEIASTTPIYAFRDFEIVSVDCDVAQLTADVELADYSTEPFPGLRATQDRFPGLFF